MTPLRDVASEYARLGPLHSGDIFQLKIKQFYRQVLPGCFVELLQHFFRA